MAILLSSYLCIIMHNKKFSSKWSFRNIFEVFVSPKIFLKCLVLDPRAECSLRNIFEVHGDL